MAAIRAHIEVDIVDVVELIRDAAAQRDLDVTGITISSWNRVIAVWSEEDRDCVTIPEGDARRHRLRDEKKVLAK